METIIFDVFGDLALFRKFYTNTSMLTYPFPPPTAAIGIIGAILGIKKKDLVDELQDIEIAVSITKPVRKIRFSLNYINTKDKTFTLSKGRTQIPTEFVKDPYYRIYVRNLKEGLKERFINLLKNHESVFIPYLGISELFCNFNFVGVDIAVDEFGLSEISSVVPIDGIEIYPTKEGLKLLKERVPHVIDKNRVVRRYTDVVIDEEGKPIPIKGSFSRIGDKNVIFFRSFRNFLSS